MSELLTAERVEAVILTGPHRGRIVELPFESAEQFSNEELGIINEALDRVLASLDRLEAEVGRTTAVFSQGRGAPHGG